VFSGLKVGADVELVSGVEDLGDQVEDLVGKFALNVEYLIY